MSDRRKYESDPGGVYYVVPPGQITLERHALDKQPRSEPAPVSPADSNTWTVSRLWDEYQKANPGLKGMSVYRAIYNAHLRRPFGGKEPAAITAFDLDRLKLDDMKGKSPKSIANSLELLRRIVNFGVRRGLCSGPSFTIQLPRVNNEKTEDLSQAELARLVSVLDGHIELGTSYLDGAAMMKLALLTGMRRGEMFRLKWSDLDFHRNNIRLREPKGGRDVVIPMSCHARRLLEQLDRLRSTGRGNPPVSRRNRPRVAVASEYVFPGMAGGQRRDIRKQVNSLKAEAGLPEDFRPLHGLRHVFASGLVSSGVEFQIVQRLLTHKGGTVTHRYAHIRDDALRAAAELAGRLVDASIE